MGTLIGILIFVGFTIGIWFSYRLFMRGNTPEEKVAALLPGDFKPDLFYRKGTPMWDMKKIKTGSCWLIGLTGKYFLQRKSCPWNPCMKRCSASRTIGLR